MIVRGVVATTVEGTAVPVAVAVAGGTWIWPSEIWEMGRRLLAWGAAATAATRAARVNEQRMVTVVCVLVVGGGSS